MSDTTKMGRKPESGKPGRRPLVDEDLADQLLDKARAEGAGLLGWTKSADDILETLAAYCQRITGAAG